jgi:hypothetical protein
MTGKRSDSIDYGSQCTVCIDYHDGGAKNRLVYERPQVQVPDRPLTKFDRLRMSQYPDDAALTEEAHAIFSDMKAKGRVGRRGELGGIFIARSAAAALEMDL